MTDQGEDQVGVCGGWDGGHRQGGEGVVAYARTGDGHGCVGDWDVGHRQGGEEVAAYAYARPDDDHGCGESGLVDTDRGLRE